MASNDVYKLNHVMKVFNDIKFGRIFKQIINLINDLRNTSIDVSKLVDGDPAMGVGTSVSTKSRMTGAIRFQMNGQEYYAAATEAVLDSDTNDITQDLFGAWRFQIDSLGALTSTAADDTGDMAFASIQDALNELSNKALVANTLVVGYLVIEAATGGFTIGTDDPVTSNAQVTAATYYDVNGDSGVITPAASIAVGGVPEQINLGASTVKVNGLKLAAISADTTLAFPVADTITADKFGGYLIVSDVAGTGYALISADGKTEAALMAYDDYAAVDAALDNIQARLTNRHVPISRVIIQNDGTLWTAITDDITDGSDVVESRFQVIAANTGILRVSESKVDQITGSVSD